MPQACRSLRRFYAASRCGQRQSIQTHLAGRVADWRSVPNLQLARRPWAQVETEFAAGGDDRCLIQQEGNPLPKNAPLRCQ